MENRILKAFTLAEVMIALVVIGVITSILLPVAFQTVPDENVMKFKKGNATLAKVINELVTSDKYYADGDLGIKADGNLLSSDNEDDIKYFCQTFADVVSTKSVNCSTYTNYYYSHYCDDWSDSEKETYNIDKFCIDAQTNVGAEIVTVDDITYFQTSPGNHFGYIGIRDTSAQTEEEYNNWDNDNQKTARLFVAAVQYGMPNTNQFGFPRTYKPICMDIDGINNGEDPFGYAIRADGKIALGKRAEEWLKKDIQSKDE